MSSILDAPKTSHSAPADVRPVTPTVGPNVATLGGPERVTGTQSGPLLTSAGRGIVNGVPYGETENQRVEALNAQYPFAPAAVARLRAASRAALGR